MYKINEILVPAKFMLLSTQVILSIIVFFTREDNITAEIPYTVSQSSAEYIGVNNSIIIALILYYVFELGQIIIVFTNLTIFLNRLNSGLILIYVISIIQLSFFMYKVNKASDMWFMFVLGG